MGHDKFYGICENKCLVEINADRVGAAGTEHTHSADDITTGVLPLERGGTGGGTATEIREVLEVEKEYVLYNNSSGTTGTITLSDSYKNYKKIVVYYKDSENACYNTATLYTDIGSKLALSNTYLFTSGTGYYVHSTTIYFSGNTVSFSRNGMVAQNEEPTIDVTLSSDTGIYVNKIIGFKY